MVHEFSSALLFKKSANCVGNFGRYFDRGLQTGNGFNYVEMSYELVKLFGSFSRKFIISTLVSEDIFVGDPKWGVTKYVGHQQLGT